MSGSIWVAVLLSLLSIFSCSNSVLSVAPIPNENVQDFTKRLVIEMNSFSKKSHSFKRLIKVLPGGLIYPVIEGSIKIFEPESVVIQAVRKNYTDFCVQRYSAVASSDGDTSSAVSVVINCFDKIERDSLIFQAVLSPVNRFNWVLTMVEVPDPGPQSKPCMVKHVPKKNR